MHVIVSNSAMTSLASAGVTPGWLTAWLISTGEKKVCHHHLQGDSWQKLSGAQLYIAEASELMPVAMAHGRRLGVGSRGALQVIGASCVHINNPDRLFWHYTHQGKAIVLMPTGDVVNQRESWLHIFSSEKPLLSVHVTADSSSQESSFCTVNIEPGLYAHIQRSLGKLELDARVGYLNHHGLMPEEQLQKQLRQHGWCLNTAESCTAGALAARFSRVPGASKVLDRGWITYSNLAKYECLGIPEETIQQHGAVSQTVALAMTEAAANEHSMGIAITGIAGPSGGGDEKSVGTVWVAISAPTLKARAFKLSLQGSRTSIQAQAALLAMAEACIRLN